MWQEVMVYLSNSKRVILSDLNRILVIAEQPGFRAA